MVAYTADFCLPYFEGSDSPCLNTGTVCDPSTVWCDFANLVEAEMVSIDAILGRTATSVPIAMITYEPATPAVPADSVVPFDAVSIDTDQMVNLEIFPGISPNRNGIYLIDLVIRVTGATTEQTIEGWITIGTEAIPVAGTSLRVATAVALGFAPNVTTDIRASVAWKFDDTSPVPRTISATSNSGEAIVYASLSAYWHSEA